ncbi:MAG: TolC family protein, partial [candidate division Zixibacteria bacterium]|nr:TolC family protein [candidate division Zixibacteria bacterium]
QFGYANQPGLLASEKSADAAGYYLRSARSSYLPTVGASASINWSDGARGDTALFNFSSRETSIGIGVSWTLFDGFWRERQVSASKIARNNARARASETRNLVAVQIKTAFYDIEKAAEQTKVAMENVEAATEDLKITQEKYNLGAATILDLLNAQVSLKDAQVKHIQAGFDLNLAVARLDKAMGRTN